MWVIGKLDTHLSCVDRRTNISLWWWTIMDRYIDVSLWTLILDFFFILVKVDICLSKRQKSGHTEQHIIFYAHFNSNSFISIVAKYSTGVYNGLRLCFRPFLYFSRYFYYISIKLLFRHLFFKYLKINWTSVLFFKYFSIKNFNLD